MGAVTHGSTGGVPSVAGLVTGSPQRTMIGYISSSTALRGLLSGSYRSMLNSRSQPGGQGASNGTCWLRAALRERQVVRWLDMSERRHAVCCVSVVKPAGTGLTGGGEQSSRVLGCAGASDAPSRARRRC
jgi:hypothetical protein